MQYHQSFCGVPNYNTFFQSSPFTPAPALPCNTNASYPSVVGEGDVTALVLPDGSTQLYFLPANKWCSPPNLFNPNIPNFNPNIQNHNTNLGLWFVRSVSNPIPHPLYQQTPVPCEIPYQSYFGWDKSYSRSLTHFGNFALPSPEGYINKFHNDGCTSTTDLVYFFPRLRSCTVPRACAGVQVSAPVDAGSGRCQCEVVRKKTSTCPDCCEVTTEEERSGPSTSKSSKKKLKGKIKKRSNGIVICECNSSDSETAVSRQFSMSVDEIESISTASAKYSTKKETKQEYKKHENSKEYKHKVKSSTDKNIKKSKKQDDHVYCECYRYDSSTEISQSSKTEDAKQKKYSKKKINKNKQVCAKKEQIGNYFKNKSNKTANKEERQDSKCECCTSISFTGSSEQSMSIKQIKPKEKSYHKKLHKTKERKQKVESSENESKKIAKDEANVLCECNSSNSPTEGSQFNMPNQQINLKDKVCCRNVQNSQSSSTTRSDKTAYDSIPKKKCYSDLSTLRSNNIAENGQAYDAFVIDSTIELYDSLSESKGKSEEVFCSCCLEADTQGKDTGELHECECGTCGLEYLKKLAARLTEQGNDFIAQSGHQTQVSHSKVEELWFPTTLIAEEAVFSGEPMSICTSETNIICNPNLADII